MNRENNNILYNKLNVKAHHIRSKVTNVTLVEMKGCFLKLSQVIFPIFLLVDTLEACTRVQTTVIYIFLQVIYTKLKTTYTMRCL